MEYLDDKFFVLRQEVPVVGGYLANEEIECLPYIQFDLKSAPDSLFLEILEFQLALIVLFFGNLVLIANDDDFAFTMFRKVIDVSQQGFQFYITSFKVVKNQNLVSFYFGIFFFQQQNGVQVTGYTPFILSVTVDVIFQSDFRGGF